MEKRILNQLQNLDWRGEAMKLIGGLFPHPPIIIPEVGGERRFEAEATLNACQELAGEIADEEPELIVFSGPHGRCEREKITILADDIVKGDLGQFNAPELKFSVSSLPGLVKEMTGKARDEGWAVEVAEDNISVRLDHGVMVPLYFLEEAGLGNIPWVIVNMAFWSPEKLFGFGQFLSEFFIDTEALFVASGDLSHRLKPGSPGGYAPEGEKFDRKLMEYLGEANIHEIIEMDSQLREKAGECGYRPLLIALGFCQNEGLNVDVKSYEGPFGVGYGVAGFYQDHQD